MKEAMVERLVEAVKGIAGEGYEVKSTVVKKNNGVELDAVNIRKAGENVVPTIYIQRELELLEADKITVHEAAKHVLGVYEENKSRKPVTDVDIKDISGRDFILQHVEYQLVNAERNAERLETVPARRIADLAALYRVVVSEDETGTASIILYNEQLAQLSEKLNDDLLIMPSSIHEVLAVPASSMNAIDLKQMVREVNDTEVSEQEILGYSVYRYNRKTGAVEVAA